MSSYNDRKEIIEELETKRKSTLITYFLLSDRGDVGQLFVGDDQLRPFHHLLEQLGHKESIDLFIYTRGGSMTTSPTIVKMFREYANNLNVLIPFRCHSAGTQIALGADGVIMSRIGQLSPIDPSTANLFNPIMHPQSNPADPRQRKPISVEDVQAYLNLSKDRVGLVSEDDKLEVFKELTRTIEPLALGNVNRVYSATRMIAKEMLSLHMEIEKDEDKIEQIVKALTETYPHDFIITRDIAKKIGLKIVSPSPEEENLMMRLFSSYEEEFKMNSPFDAEDFLSRQQQPVSRPPSQLPSPTPSQPQSQPASVQPPQTASDQAQSQAIPFQALQQQSMTTQPRSFNFKIKLGAIESSVDSFMQVTDVSVYPPMQMGGAPIVNFKLGTWLRSSQIGGMNFE